MSANIRVHTFDNGITLVGEQRPHMSSAAFAMLVGIGASTDPASQIGSASILSEMFNRGAGPWSSRELSAEFESLGAQRNHTAGIEVSVFSCAALGTNLAAILDRYATVLLSPTLDKTELENVRLLALHELHSLEDEPSSKVMVNLTGAFYPEPYGRPQMGTVEGVKSVTAESLRDYYNSCFKPNRCVIGVAGDFDFDEAVKVIGDRFGMWSGENPPPPLAPLPTKPSVHHIHRETAQQQIALAYPSAQIDDPDYYAARLGVGILSGGMAGRLFIEVREKRGLVYSVRASHSASKGRAAVFCYAGTTPDNGEETLSVIMEQLRGLPDDIKDEELARAKADIKSRLVMQSESSISRASQLVNDWWSLGRIRDIEEIKSKIDEVQQDDIRRVCERYPASAVTLSTIGPKSLEIPN